MGVEQRPVVPGCAGKHQHDAGEGGRRKQQPASTSQGSGAPPFLPDENGQENRSRDPGNCMEQDDPGVDEIGLWEGIEIGGGEA